MKKLIGIILLISMLLLPSCATLTEGILMPNIRIDHTFENDTWLVVEDRLINKIDGTSYLLELDSNITIPEAYDIRRDSVNSYKYEFLESSVKEYIFLSAYWKNSTTAVYYECVITYNYEGKETDRFYIGEALTKEKMQELYQSRSIDIEAFSFYVLGNGAGRIWDRFTSITKEETSAEKRAILNFAENLYESQSDGAYYQIEGLAKSMGDEIWFSTSGTNRLSVKADPLISGIRENQITAYNIETNEFRTVFEYDKKRTQIIDFDENGAYILDSNGKFGYVDFETKKLTEIHEFSGIDRIFVTDKYICVKYQLNGYTYFVYEKGGDVIANDSSLD